MWKAYYHRWQDRSCSIIAIQKITFKKLSLIKINGVIIALKLSENIYYRHKSVLRAVTKQCRELSRTRQDWNAITARPTDRLPHGLIRNFASTVRSITIPPCVHLNYLLHITSRALCKKLKLCTVRWFIYTCIFLLIHVIVSNSSQQYIV